LGELDAVSRLLAIHEDALVVVINRYRQLLLGLLLPDDVLVEERLHFLGLGKLVWSRGLWGGRAVILKNGIADRNTLVTNIRPRIVAGGRDQFCNCVLRFVTERTAQDFVCARPVFHSALLLVSHPDRLPCGFFRPVGAATASRRDLQ